MPLLRQILTQANDKDHNMMRAKALECISLIGMSIGRDRFRNDAHQVLQYMQSLQVGHHTQTQPQSFLVICLAAFFNSDITRKQTLLLQHAPELQLNSFPRSRPRHLLLFGCYL